jgi:cytochrome c553
MAKDTIQSCMKTAFDNHAKHHRHLEKIENDRAEATEGAESKYHSACAKCHGDAADACEASSEKFAAMEEVATAANSGDLQKLIEGEVEKRMNGLMPTNVHATAPGLRLVVREGSPDNSPIDNSTVPQEFREAFGV